MTKETKRKKDNIMTQGEEEVLENIEYELWEAEQRARNIVGLPCDK